MKKSFGIFIPAELHFSWRIYAILLKNSKYYIRELIFSSLLSEACTSVT